MADKKPLSDARKRANKKYDMAHIKRISLMMPKEEFESIERHILTTDEKRNTFIRRAVKETIERETEE